MDDVTFAARRATSVSRSEPDVEMRFRTLVQSPLRAGILRFLSARPGEAFDLEALMQAFGRMRMDIDNCIRELVDFGVAKRVPGATPSFTAVRPDGPAAALLDQFLERRAHLGVEESSPSVQRFREMIGRDEKMLAIFEWIRTAAKSDISVLILGPTGAGKEVVARMIHELSRRGQERFQAVNCAALPDTLFESEIFGYEKGAFTGAHDRKPGRLEMANGGTLFLDEVGDLSLVAQAKLLRVLEERRFERLGGNRSIHVDFRLISATNRPLDLFVREGRFREDLYYRLNVIRLRVPPLRERREEVPLLAQALLEQFGREGQREPIRLSDEAIEFLTLYHWPGNARQLANELRRVSALAEPGALVMPEHLSPEIAASRRETVAPAINGSSTLLVRTDQPLSAATEHVERVLIAQALDRFGGNLERTAQHLGLSRKGLFLKRQRLGLA